MQRDGETGRVLGEKAPSHGGWRGECSALHHAASMDLLSLWRRKDKKRLVSKKQILYCVKTKQTSEYSLPLPHAPQHCLASQWDVPRCPKQAGAVKARTDLSSDIYRIIKASQLRCC